MRGEPLTAVNLTGFAICSLGVLLYHFVKQRKEGARYLRAVLHSLRLGSVGWGERFVQMLDEDGAPAPADARADGGAVPAAARVVSSTERGAELAVART